MFGAETERRGNNETPTGNKASAQSGSRVTCWKCGKRGHVQRDCPEKTTSASTLMAQEASTEEEGSSHAVPTAENKFAGAGIVRFSRLLVMTLLLNCSTTLVCV